MKSHSSASPSHAVDTASDLLGPWFRALARSVQTGVVLLSDRGEPVFANHAANELLGLPPAAAPAEGLERLKEVLPPELRSAGSGRAEVAVESDLPTGKRRVELRSVPLEGKDCGALILIEDRTRSAALEASLVLASRMQTGSLFRSQVHDLKAPLNALSVNLELLRRSLEEEEGKPDGVREEQLSAARALQREVARLGRSLDVVLRQIVQPQSSSARRIDVRRSVREVAQLVRPTVRSAGIRLRTELPDVPIRVHVSDDLLKQALLNLVLNAFEAQPEGGEIRLCVGLAEGSARIAVEDEGPGIPGPLRERVFEMGFSTKTGGNGVGLTVARSLVESQAGRLTLASGSGRGTTVEVHLPGAKGQHVNSN